MQAEEILAEVTKLQEAFDILLPTELALLVAEGALKREALDADRGMQRLLVIHGSQHMRWLDKKIHEKNLDWNIAEGLY